MAANDPDHRAETLKAAAAVVFESAQSPAADFSRGVMIGRWVVVEDRFVHEVNPETGEEWTEDEAQRQARFAQQDRADVLAEYREE